MTTPADLTSADTHYAFGKNWASYAEGITDVQIEAAIHDLKRLLGDHSLAGARFLDIGCGSGLHSLAAIRLGAAHVDAVDIDEDSVATTRAVLHRFAPHASVHVRQCSVFDLPAANPVRYGVVYSWGVLHHTGDMVPALRAAASMVDEDGVFLFALYRRTWLCPFWRREKRWYSQATPAAQRRAERLFIGWHRLLRATAAGLQWLRGQRRTTAPPNRGMDYYHDVRDWLGGFPYESTVPDDVHSLMAAEGLSRDAVFPCAPTPGRTHGLLGSGCDEYRYRRRRS